ncbi:MAG: carbohydrate kinase [Actinomycetia bacterium]|nr:carbohydrate kinase [Actinomycetes bacterium]
MGAPLDVVAVGNALVDVIALESDEFLVEHGLVKGSMTLVDERRALDLYAAMRPQVEASGGSAANTMAGLVSLGGRGGFVGRVRDDHLGQVFARDLDAVGVEVSVAPADAGPGTGCSLIVVTPDGERTMSTLLGAACMLGPDDVDERFVARAEITYLEGYLFDHEAAGEAFRKAAGAAHAAGRRVALSLSDSFCVERFQDGFRALVGGIVDILFGNDAELCLLYDTDDVEHALAAAARTTDIVVVTRGAAGAYVSAGGVRFEVAAAPVADVVDTTGAGDLFASGFLFGITRGFEVGVAARLGALAAAEVIAQLGARPQAPLASLGDRLRVPFP